MEIERKFLINDIMFDLSPYTAMKIEQRYVSVNPTIRIRKINPVVPNKKKTKSQYILTVKGKGTIAKEEFELEIDKKQYEELLKKVIKKSKPIKKIRYLIPLDNTTLTAELDVYSEKLSGFYTVEVEFESIDDANNFKPPIWFGKEVSTNSKYSNASLSLVGLPSKILKQAKLKSKKKKKG